MKLAIVDYGMGNITSIIGALKFVGLEKVIVSNDIRVLADSDKLILPGVGNYATAMRKIIALNLDKQLKELVLGKKKPILGICLGMQLLGCSSTESGFHEGLNLINGTVERFSESGLKIPHVGYNQVVPFKNSRLYSFIDDEPDFYFTHSYRMFSSAEIGQSYCCYGSDFVASFELDYIAGVQFHPELSQKNGLQLIKNFIELF